ncbi:MAG: hypothetical protein H6629_17535 [Calditrichae bacterium]|nr:hypothetical protein [Calditrichia bacterium]
MGCRLYYFAGDSDYSRATTRSRRFGGNNTATQIYFVDNISQAHSELINRFNAEYSGRIEVVPVDLPFEKFSTNERKQLLAKSLRSKSDRIDVFAIDLIWGRVLHAGQNR